MSLRTEVKIDVILHATENLDKIFESFLYNLNLERKNFEVQNLTGHFDNPILLISSKLKKKNAQNFIKLLFSKMKKNDFEEVFENVEDYVTSSGLNLRISKQKLIVENLTISKEDAIKINISTPVYVKNNTKKIYQELMKV